MAEADLVLQGTWYARGSTASRDAALELSADSYRLTGDDDRQGALDELAVQAVPGAAPRRIEWPDGSLFETSDDGELDAWLDAHRARGRFARRLGAVERRPAWILASLLLTVGIAVGMYRFGLPALANLAVHRMPVSAFERLSDGVLDMLDTDWLAPSALSPARQKTIAERFEAMVAQLPEDDFDYRLAFRRRGDMPNAFALPNGQIVLLDGLVDLAQTPDQIDSVLLHEIGHVRLRHGVRTLLQSRVISLIATLATGSSTGVSELASQLGSQLLRSAYSREAEREADTFAFEAMIAGDRDPAAFAAIIRALSSGGGVVPGWLASHPDGEQRAERALDASRQRTGEHETGEEPGG